MTDERDDVVAALAAQQDDLITRVATRTHDELGAASRCTGWTVADVLLHLAQTNEMAVASVKGRLRAYVDEVAADLAPTDSVDAWAGALVDRERTTVGEARDRYQRSATAQVDAFAACDPATRVQWVAGELAARSLATTRLTETWIHTVDVAVAFGPEPASTDRLWHTARLVWRTLPYAFGRAGRELTGDVAFVLDAPGGSTWDFGDPDTAPTVLRGTARDLCTVAGQRADAADTGLTGTGPDAAGVLALMRTFA